VFYTYLGTNSDYSVIQRQMNVSITETESVYCVVRPECLTVFLVFSVFIRLSHLSINTSHSVTVLIMCTYNTGFITLGLTQPLTEMSTRNISWGGGGSKGSRCIGLTTSPSSYSDCLEIWESEPHATLRACPGPSRNCFTLYIGGRGSSVGIVTVYGLDGPGFKSLGVK
jgi:hypothetical protein